MSPSLRIFLTALVTSVLASSSDANTSPVARQDDGSTRDVVIIGGGAAGTYTAVRLRDSGKSVLLVESADRLGGHTSTYYDPSRGEFHNYGADTFEDNEALRNFFARFNVSLSSETQVVNFGTSNYIDSKTGEIVDFTPPNATEVLANWIDLVRPYASMKYGIDFFPDTVDEELLSPFGDYVEKHNLSEAVWTLSQYAGGLVSILDRVTFEVYAALTYGRLATWGVEPQVVVASGDGAEVYHKARKELGEDVLLSSRVQSLNRGNETITLHISTPEGTRIVQAKKLVVAISPLLESLEGFDLDSSETDAFSGLNATGYHVGLVEYTGIPDNDTMAFIGKDTPYNLPQYPGVVQFSQSAHSGSNIKPWRWGVDGYQADDEVEAGVRDELHLLRRTGRISNATQGEPVFLTHSQHYPFLTFPTADAIRNGAFKKLKALQGYRNTFYTGNFYSNAGTPGIWNYTEHVVLPLLLE